MAAGKREENESFKAYRLRLRNEEFRTKVQMQGKVIWKSNISGTYIKAKHGVL